MAFLIPPGRMRSASAISWATRLAKSCRARPIRCYWMPPRHGSWPSSPRCAAKGYEVMPDQFQQDARIDLGCCGGSHRLRGRQYPLSVLACPACCLAAHAALVFRAAFFLHPMPRSGVRLKWLFFASETLTLLLGLFIYRNSRSPQCERVSRERSSNRR